MVANCRFSSQYLFAISVSLKMTEVIGKRKFRTEKIAPDGGWGLIIGLGLAVSLVNLTNSKKKKKYK